MKPSVVDFKIPYLEIAILLPIFYGFLKKKKGYLVREASVITISYDVGVGVPWKVVYTVEICLGIKSSLKRPQHYFRQIIVIKQSCNFCS